MVVGGDGGGCGSDGLMVEQWLVLQAVALSIVFHVVDVIAVVHSVVYAYVFGLASRKYAVNCLPFFFLFCYFLAVGVLLRSKLPA